MIKFIDILKEIDVKEKSGILTIYRGVDPKFGDINHGRMSIGKMHKLVGALGPNYSDKKEVAERYGKQIIVKKFSSPKILELNTYNDVVRLYDQYKFQFNMPNLANFISSTPENSKEQFEYIQKAAKELRDILSTKYDLVKSPLGKGDVEYLKSKGIVGASLYVLLRY